jgi:hypothetical protein
MSDITTSCACGTVTVTTGGVTSATVTCSGCVATPPARFDTGLGGLRAALTRVHNLLVTCDEWLRTWKAMARR